MILELEVKDKHEAKAIMAIVMERRMQDQTFGDQRHDPAYWYAIMGKQFGQAGTRVLDMKWADVEVAVLAENALYHEIVQTAAVAVAFLRAIGKAELVDEITTAKPSAKRNLARALNYDGEAMHAKADES